MQIGLFGGTFNPIHFGHLRTIEEVCESFPLDFCHLVPAASPPHKPAKQVAEAGDRLEMARRAVLGCPHLRVSSLEIQRGGLSYTIDTVNAFRSGLSDHDALHLVVGQDAFLDIDSWKSMHTLFDAVAVIVMTRPIRRDARRAQEQLGVYLKTKISPDYKWSNAANAFRHPVKKPVHLVAVTQLAISSSDIRRRIRDRRSIRFLVPGDVAQYIAARKIYQ
jgi:nicotinate-nucleotide adenylyltransferase